MRAPPGSEWAAICFAPGVHWIVASGGFSGGGCVQLSLDAVSEEGTRAGKLNPFQLECWMEVFWGSFQAEKYVHRFYAYFCANPAQQYSGNCGLDPARISPTLSVSAPMDYIPPDHFLALSRLDGLLGLGSSESTYDTSTLAAHDFDVDNRTGFMPPHAPPARLPADWEAWELVLDAAIGESLQLGDKPGIISAEMSRSESWRQRVRELAVIPISGLIRSETNLRRAHLVLAWTMHFYIHSLPPHAPVVIPAPITIPLFQICTQLQLPPVLTYSDTVLYNWTLKTPSNRPTPALDNLQSRTLFTGTNDEQEFYLTSARMELRGVEALELMRSTMDEAFVGDDLAMRRITTFLEKLATVIDDLQRLIAGVRDGCDPTAFYTVIRPWFRGADSDPAKRKWEFDGLDSDPSWTYPTETSGPSAGQSSLIHALDMFLGVAEFSHARGLTGSSSSTQTNVKKSPFLTRMQLYMPRHHRNFLNHLAANPRPLREIVAGAEDAKLRAAYNLAVDALKRFRDYHITIVTSYIIQPARHVAAAKAQAESAAAGAEPEAEAPLKGTGGTELAKFLKAVRDRTAAAMLES
ncbi:Indoleamine 2,3-dioxygenase-domain-containing protein [Mycena crocata]|nr:Indoleamine 2,3-dioxygenase-domain-containing protein [Mycena crocata]